MMPIYSLAAGLFVLDRHQPRRWDASEVLAAIAKAGFNETELMAEGEDWLAPAPRDPGNLRRILDEFGIRPRSIHTPMAGVNLASFDEATRQASVARVADAMRLLGALGGEVAIVHPTGPPGPGEPAVARENMGAAMEQAWRSLAELVAVAEESGVQIALENLHDKGWVCRPLVNMQELRAFIAGFPAAQVGLCLDTGHAILAGCDPADQARIASERLLALHLHDVDGEDDRHWLPGQGVIDWAALSTALREIHFDGIWTLEVLTKATPLSAEEVAGAAAALAERWSIHGMA